VVSCRQVVAGLVKNLTILEVTMACNLTTEGHHVDCNLPDQDIKGSTQTECLPQPQWELGTKTLMAIVMVATLRASIK
jgi:hypothetical protein